MNYVQTITGDYVRVDQIIRLVRSGDNYTAWLTTGVTVLLDAAAAQAVIGKAPPKRVAKA